MKTVRLLKVSHEFADYISKDGAFYIRKLRNGNFHLSIPEEKEHTWKCLAEVSSLRCARVWIKNFYRTLVIKKELVSLEACEIDGIAYVRGMTRPIDFHFDPEGCVRMMSGNQINFSNRRTSREVAEFILSNS